MIPFENIQKPIPKVDNRAAKNYKQCWGFKNYNNSNIVQLGICTVKLQPTHSKRSQNRW